MKTHWRQRLMCQDGKRSQNELNVSQAENKLNQQSLAPLQEGEGV